MGRGQMSKKGTPRLLSSKCLNDEEIGAAAEAVVAGKKHRWKKHLKRCPKCAGMGREVVEALVANVMD